MSTVRGGGPHGGGHGGDGRSPEEPDFFEPGLDPLIRALTASGHPHERAGRDAALAAFRAANQQPHPSGMAERTRRSGAHDHPGRQRRPLRLLLPARLAAVGAAGFTVLVGVTAAAYAQALPAPVQRVAHSVLAPLGVPNSKPDPYAPSALPSGTASSVTASSVTASPGTASSGSTSSSGASPGSASSATANPTSTTSVSVTTSPSASASGQASPTASTTGAVQYAIVLTATHARVPYGQPDLFTAQVTSLGQPAAHLKVRLLERVAGTTGWQLVIAGVTGKLGRVALSDPSLTKNAAFRLALPEGVRSAAVTVTVGRAIRLRLLAGPGPYKDRLIVTAPGGSPGETVGLTELVSGTWETVASKPLGPELHAVFTLPVSTAAGYLYRAELPETATTTTPTASNRVWIPRKSGTGATVVQPTASQSPTPDPTPSATATPTATATPDPSSPS